MRGLAESNEGAMMKLKIAAALALVLAAPTAAQSPKLKLWRLDCGDFIMKKYGAWFSDTFQYPAGAKPLVGSCYLIANGDRYLLWDTGLADELAQRPVDNEEQRMSLKRSLLQQLGQIGVRPEQIEIVGISHFHADHTGQARHFPNAKLVIGRADWDALKNSAHPGLKDAKEHLAHWLTGPGKAVQATGDVDIFHDGRVVMLAMPGHTPGHSALLVRLESGPVLLSGDQYHFTEAVRNRGVPSFNTDRADTLASHDRFDRIADNLKAKVVIQHEPADIAKLPAFPQAAE
jgi:glyoxylase-like metal-dependent hydrolase (beta-lactamase superfamily II)